MKWSQMTGQQRAFLQASARWQKIMRSNGEVIGAEPAWIGRNHPDVDHPSNRCPYAQWIVAAKAADRDANAKRKRDGIAEMQALVAAELGRTVMITRCKAGKARGADYLNRPKAQALPMGEMWR